MSLPGAECFVRQEATERILERVSRFCAECYREFVPGEEIYYDMHAYRYLCRECADEQAHRLNEACEPVEEPESSTLF